MASNQPGIISALGSALGAAGKTISQNAAANKAGKPLEDVYSAPMANIGSAVNKLMQPTTTAADLDLGHGGGYQQYADVDMTKLSKEDYAKIFNSVRKPSEDTFHSKENPYLESKEGWDRPDVANMYKSLPQGLRLQPVDEGKDPMTPYTPEEKPPTYMDADLKEPGGDAHWTLREQKDFILAKNQRTGEIGKVKIDPLSKDEKKQAMAEHGAGSLEANDPNRKRIIASDLDFKSPNDILRSILGPKLQQMEMSLEDALNKKYRR